MSARWCQPVFQTLPEQVAKTILGRIASGELKPGDQLPPQRELARGFNVGLSVVREAIQRLEVLKILATRQGVGTEVRPFRWMQLIYDPDLFMVGLDLIQAKEFWEARHGIERETLRLATLRAGPEELGAMQAILAQATPAPTDHDRHMELNRAFHLAIARAADNTVLEDILAPLLSVRLPFASRGFNAERARLAWEVHGDMYQAILAGDTARAAEALETHAKVGVVVLEAVENGRLA